MKYSNSFYSRRVIMKTTKLISHMLATVMLISLYGTASAQGFPEKTGYVIDTRGNVIKTAYGLCVRTGYWTPAMAIAECDPGLVLKPEMIMKEMPLAAGPTAPAPAPSAPTPTIVAAVVPATPAVEAHFNAETLFDFDRAVVKP